MAVIITRTVTHKHKFVSTGCYYMLKGGRRHFLLFDYLNVSRPRYTLKYILFMEILHINALQELGDTENVVTNATMKAQDGRYCNTPPSVHLSVCLFITFSFRTVTQKRIAVFSQKLYRYVHHVMN